MDIKTADRLMELRKKAGYSQEELGEKIGVSRQAVSKWERAESSPDIDNLIALSKLYGISIDELLDTEKPIGDIPRAEKKKEKSKAGDDDSFYDGDIPFIDVPGFRMKFKDIKKWKKLGKLKEWTNDDGTPNEVRVDEDGIYIKKGKAKFHIYGDDVTIEADGERYHFVDGEEVGD